MNQPIRAIAAILTAAFLFAALPAQAQVASFKAEIDCDGVVSGGATVPFLLEFENQTLTNIPISVTVAINVPTLGSFTIRQGNLTLGPNQHLFLNQMITLPAQVPNGQYTMSIIGTSANETSMDTCSFHVA